MKLLITGFPPFAGATENPSKELLGLLASKYSTLLLPNAVRRAPAILMRSVGRIRPDTVLHLGESRHAKEIIVERGARNLLDTNIPDNDGNSAHDEPVVNGGPAYLRTTMPWKAVEHAIAEAGIPVRNRRDGGSHVSNQVFYRLLHSGRVPRVGYIHIPPIQHRRGGPGMPLVKLLGAVSTAIDVLRRTDGRSLARSRRSRR
jgi:pyroglutamyl-peptidase